jgi:Asp-tRNA(Asn)/Glu-tRNA(Gln) amidotransferase A subunit family amidase
LKPRLDAAWQITRADYDAVRETARQCRRALADRMREVDFLLTPSATSEAPRSLESTGDPVFNRAWTLLGVPCVTVPHGKGAHGLPLGVQLVGPFDGDSALLGWAHWTADALSASG